MQRVHDPRDDAAHVHADRGPRAAPDGQLADVAEDLVHEELALVLVRGVRALGRRRDGHPRHEAEDERAHRHHDGHAGGHGDEQRQPQRGHDAVQQGVAHRAGDDSAQDERRCHLLQVGPVEDHEHLHGEHGGERGNPAAGEQAAVEQLAQDERQAGRHEHGGEDVAVARHAGAGVGRLLALERGGHEAHDDHADGGRERRDERALGQVGEEPGHAVEGRALDAAGHHSAEVVDEVVVHEHGLQVAHERVQRDGSYDGDAERRQDLLAGHGRRGCFR